MLRTVVPLGFIGTLSRHKRSRLPRDSALFLELFYVRCSPACLGDVVCAGTKSVTAKSGEPIVLAADCAEWRREKYQQGLQCIPQIPYSCTAQDKSSDEVAAVGRVKLACTMWQVPCRPSHRIGLRARGASWAAGRQSSAHSGWLTSPCSAEDIETPLSRVEEGWRAGGLRGLDPQADTLRWICC